MYHGKETVLQRHSVVSFEDERLVVKTKFYLEVFLFNSVFQVELLILQGADSLMVVFEDTLNSLCDGHTHRHSDTHRHINNIYKTKTQLTWLFSLRDSDQVTKTN